MRTLSCSLFVLGCVWLAGCDGAVSSLSTQPLPAIDAGAIETLGDASVAPPDAGEADAGASTQPDAGAADAGAPRDAGFVFVHPGVLVDRAHLDFVKAKIVAKAAPWKEAFDQTVNSRYGSLSYAPTPRATVECGSYSMPDFGCSNEKDDVVAAYTHALLWYFTGDEAHARKAIEIINAWSAVLKEHTNTNAPLQAAWCASVWPRAAEIMRYTYSGWASADVDRFALMLKTAYLPYVINGSRSNGNWELSMIEASIGIGVALDDPTVFNKAVSMWRKRVPAYLYLTSDGATPVPPPAGNATTPAQLNTFWYSPGPYVNGLGQETCRDLGHQQLGVAAMINAAETAYLQGVDLYQEQKSRITTGLEFHAQYLDGVAVPSSLCGGTLTDATPTEMWEIAYNHYVNRAGGSLPHTQNVIAKVRPTGVNHHMAWETLTHALTH